MSEETEDAATLLGEQRQPKQANGGTLHKGLRGLVWRYLYVMTGTAVLGLFMTRASTEVAFGGAKSFVIAAVAFAFLFLQASRLWWALEPVQDQPESRSEQDRNTPNPGPGEDREFWQMLWFPALVASLGTVVLLAALREQVKVASFYALVGFVFATVVGHVAIAPVTQWVWAQSDGGENHNNQAALPWLAAPIGWLERAAYVTALLMQKEEFIGAWLVLKVAGQFTRWTVDSKKRSLYNLFLLGNGLSLAYAAVGYMIVLGPESWDMSAYGLMPTVPFILVTATFAAWVYMLRAHSHKYAELYERREPPTVPSDVRVMYAERSQDRRSWGVLGGYCDG